MENIKSVVLMILDGWGLRPDAEYNAIINAKTPVMDTLQQNYPFISLQAAGESVGLPWGEMGNSEVGHINIGSGRVVLSDFTQITQAIENGSYEKNPNLLKAIDSAKKNNKKFHIIGIISNATVHGNADHILSSAKIAGSAGLEVVIHAISDGRDTPPKIALELFIKLEEALSKINNVKIKTISGRYFAMDRDKRYERVQCAYEAMTLGKGEKASSVKEAIEKSYQNGKTDEFILPVVINEPINISENDSVLFTNFRCDRALQLTKAFVDKQFTGFKRELINNLFFATMTEYEHCLGVYPLFNVVDLNNPSSNPLSNPLAQVISEANLTQLHMAETEKYAHVTYFFNAGNKEPFKGETQLLVPSPKVATYDLQPEMSVRELTKQFIEKFNQINPNFSVINFANADMVGHTGIYEATIKACETVDQQIGLIYQEIAKKDGILIITADHGNAEELLNIETKVQDKEHSTFDVPLIIVGKNGINKDISFQPLNIEDKIKLIDIKPIGLLADIAPTIIDIFNLKKPDEMTGQTLWEMI